MIRKLIIAASVMLAASPVVLADSKFPQPPPPPPSLVMPFNLYKQLILVDSKGCHFTVEEDERSGSLLVKKLQLDNGEPFCKSTTAIEKGVSR